jgi:membrane protein DedA with SNARE-associated domain
MFVVTSAIGWSPVALAGLLALAEGMPGVGVFLPGEIMITALATSVPGFQTPLLGLAVVVGACVGDQLNYWLGRLMGPRLSSSMVFRKLGPARWDRALELIDRHGARAVLVSRLIPVVRAIVPGVAGAASLSPARFTAASVAGSVAWALVWVGAGAVAGSLSAGSLSLVIVGAGVLLLTRRWLRRRPSAGLARSAAAVTCCQQ